VIERLATLAGKSERLVVGLMSGTSMDGVDAALVRLRGNGLSTGCELLQFLCHPYEHDLHDQLLHAASGGTITALDAAALDFRVAATFARASLELIAVAGRRPEDVDLIGSHGQTLAHRAPGWGTWEPFACTWQAGSGAAIAALTGIPVLWDFRSADVALGGTGAPLVPYVDYLLCRSTDESRLLLNIGGIANWTYLPADAGIDDVLAWDLGPGNMVLDALSQALLSSEMDAGGVVAARGSPDTAWIERMLRVDFFKRKPPKSAGREEFGAAFVARLLEEGRERALSAEDMLATAVELTVQAIARARRDAPMGEARIDALYVAGGGRHNRTLMRRLAEELAPVEVRGFELLGLDAAAKEAVQFAVLANESLHGHAGNLPQVTGAQRPCVLGTLSVAGATPRPLH
jgi:anhydro-N-acetylmuramic acid kinase